VGGILTPRALRWYTARMKNHIPASEWRRRIEAWKAGGQTAAEFGARHGIDSRQLYWWSWWLRKKAGKQAPSRGPDKAAAVRFLPVKVSPAPLAAVEVNVIRKIQNGWPASRLHELMPEAWQPASGAAVA